MARFCTLCDQEKDESEFYIGRARCISCDMMCKDKNKHEALIQDKFARDEKWIDRYGSNYQEVILNTPGQWDANEKWTPVKNFFLQYEVSDKGRVRSHWEHKRGNYWRKPTPRILSNYVNPDGYHSLSLIDWHTGEQITHHVHRIVLEGFKGFSPSNRHVCGHRDGNPSNNHLANLAWITYEENEADKRRHGRNLAGERNHQSKLNESDVREIRRLWGSGLTTPELSILFNISRTVAHKIAVRKAWKHVS